MIDAAKGFIKDGNKNRLREQDIHRIVDTFNKLNSVPGYARMVPFDEITDAKNDYNLNLPRYIDTSEPEDLHDIHAHLNGGIPVRDIDGDASALPPIPGLSAYWQALPGLRQALFTANAHPGYADLAVEPGELKTTILQHPEFADFRSTIDGLFAQWRTRNTPVFKAFDIDDNPKTLITQVGEDLLETFRQAPLLNPYDIYQHLMDYWADTLQDDAYEITADGWVAKPKRIVEEITSGKKKGQTKDKGWACDLIPKPYIVARYFAEEQAELDALQAELDSASSRLTELEEEHGGDEGALRDVSSKGDAQEAFTQAMLDALKEDAPTKHAHYASLKADLDAAEAELTELSAHAFVTPLKNTKGKLVLKDVKDRHDCTDNSGEKSVLASYIDTDKACKQHSKQLKAFLTELETDYRTQLTVEPLREQLTDLKVVADYLELIDQQAELKKTIKEKDAALDQLAHDKYAKLSVDEIKTLVVDDKWLAALEAALQNELDRVSQTLTGRVRQLADRYATPLPELIKQVEILSAKVHEHIKVVDTYSLEQLVSGEVRISGFDQEWRSIRLGELGRTYGGLVGKSKGDFGSGSALYIPFTNVMENTVVDCQKLEKVKVDAREPQNQVEKGDLLFNGSSETPEEVAMCALMEQEVPNLFLNSFCFGFRIHEINKLDPLYLVYFMRSNSGRELVKSLAQGSTRYNLSKTALLKLRIALPSIEEQRAIVGIISDLDAEIQALEQRRSKTAELKQGMMQELLTGRTRLV
jgi:type I restriction enzyme M protein